MHEGWIPLECISCGEQWEQSPAELPPRGSDFTCENCGELRPLADFVRTQEGLEIIEKFHQ